MSREFGGGWETGSFATEGFNATGGGTIDSTLTNQHRDRDGNGGTYCVVGTGGSNVARQIRVANNNVRALVEAWDRDLVFLGFQAGAAGRYYVHSFYNGTTELGSVNFDNTTGTIAIYTSTATLVATSASGVFPYNRYFVLAIQFRLLDAGGLYNVYVDGVLVLTYSGDTKPGADATFNAVGFAVCGGATNKVDEYCRNSITLEYDTGISGIPTAGQTVTGTTSGATGIITAVEGNAVSGVLVLRNWNGTAFQNNEQITTPALLDAQVNAPDANYVNGFQPNSGQPGEGFVVPNTPSGVGATTQLTSSSGNPNWQNVDEIPANTTDYNSSATNNQYDTYAATDLPASAAFVVAVMGMAYATRTDAVVNNYRHAVRTGGVDYFGTVDTPLTLTTYATQFWSWNVNPGTLTSWTVAEVNASEPGFQVKT